VRNRSETVDYAIVICRLEVDIRPFPGHLSLLSRTDLTRGGSYYSQALDIEYSLCPALFKQFDRAAAELHFQAKPKPIDNPSVLKPREITLSFD